MFAPSSKRRTIWACVPFFAALRIAACCGAHTPTADQGYVCDAPKGKDYRGYDWFDNGKPDLAANGTNSAELIRAAATRAACVHCGHRAACEPTRRS